MKARVGLALGIGAAVFAAVLWRFDLSAVMAAMTRVGLSGFVAILFAGLGLEVMLSLGLIPFLPRRVPFSVVVAARQLRDSAGDVLPITQLGGVAFAARALVLAGVGAAEAAAAVIADVTTEVFAQGLYVLTGVLASLSLLRADTALSAYVGAMLGGAVFLSLGSMAFAVVQVTGSRWMGRLGDRLFPASVSHIQGFHAAISALYGRKDKVLASMLLQWAGWMASGVWLWVVLKTMGLPTGLWAAIAIQALLEGLRSATVFIPAAIGVQEVGYAALAPVFGLTPEIGLAISLLRRARDVVVAVPVFLAWQAIEGRRAFKP